MQGGQFQSVSGIHNQLWVTVAQAFLGADAVSELASETYVKSGANPISGLWVAPSLKACARVALVRLTDMKLALAAKTPRAGVLAAIAVIATGCTEPPRAREQPRATVGDNVRG